MYSISRVNDRSGALPTAPRPLLSRPGGMQIGLVVMRAPVGEVRRHHRQPRDVLRSPPRFLFDWAPLLCHVPAELATLDARRGPENCPGSNTTSHRSCPVPLARFRVAIATASCASGASPRASWKTFKLRHINARSSMSPPALAVRPAQPPASVIDQNPNALRRVVDSARWRAGVAQGHAHLDHDAQQKPDDGRYRQPKAPSVAQYVQPPVRDENASVIGIWKRPHRLGRYRRRYPATTNVNGLCQESLDYDARVKFDRKQERANTHTKGTPDHCSKLVAYEHLFGR